jgi:large subunit ribosomal protein L25
MPAMPKLKTTERKDGNNNVLRAEGMVPAVYYGAKQESVPVAVPKADFMKVWKEVGETSTVELDTPKGSVNAMIQEVQMDPIKNEVVHVDFYVVQKGQKVEVAIPLVFEGEAPVEKQGGIVVKVMHELAVEGEPQNIPHELIIDVTTLTELDSQILAKDITLPSGVELTIEPEEVIAAVSEAKEEEEESTGEVDMSAIEVEEKGKKEEEPAE